MAASRFAALALVLAAAGSAVAQTPPPGGGRDPAAHREEWRARMQAHEAQEAADVSLLLRLRPEQAPAYQAWQASMRPPEGERGREGGMSRDDGAAPQTTAQELDRMQAKIAEHEARARSRLDATRRFYGALSPEQQKLFDALMRLHGGHRGGPHEGGERRPHGPGGRPAMGEGPPAPGE